MEEGWGWQPSTKDNADASSLVHLAPNSALHSRKEPAGLLVLCYEGADKDREVEEERGGRWRVKEGQSRQQGTRGDVNVAPVIDELEFLSTFMSVRTVAFADWASWDTDDADGRASVLQARTARPGRRVPCLIQSTKNTTCNLLMATRSPVWIHPRT